jgi:hypothetical protein
MGTMPGALNTSMEIRLRPELENLIKPDVERGLTKPWMNS